MTKSAPTTPRRLAGWLLAAATAGYTGVLLFMTHHPRPHALIGPHAPSDKTLHVWAYGVLALLAAATLAAWGRWRPRPVAGLAGGLAAFGVFDELTQPLPWFRRTSDPVDWLYDCVGIGLGLALIAAGVAVARMAPRATR